MPSRAYFTETKSVPTKKAAISSEVSASAAFPFEPWEVARILQSVISAFGLLC